MTDNGKPLIDDYDNGFFYPRVKSTGTRGYAGPAPAEKDRAPDSLVARLREVPHVTLCREAADRIEQLERDYVSAATDGNKQYQKRLVAEARLARIEQAAARYEWLRDIGNETWTPLIRRHYLLRSAEIDESIDDAIRAAKELEKR